MNKFALIMLLCTLQFNNLHAANELNLYLDADLSVFKESGNSIKQGIQTAIEFFNKNNKNVNFKVKLISLDHRGNTRRSLGNFKKVLDDPKAIAVFGGLHSPPLITNNSFINNNKLLTFVSWAAGGPITRSRGDENWIYRLSIDDAQAGEFIAKYAVVEKGCKNPFLVLEKTPWGKSNEKNMKMGLKKHGIKAHKVQLFGWGISKSSSAEIAETISKSNSDCIFFVGNGKDAKTIFNSLGDQKLTLPVFSHWGITGGNTLEMSKVVKKNKLDVQIIQTRFSFLNKKLSKFQQEIKKLILTKFALSGVKDIKPMSGWVHSFDLTSIVLNSLARVDTSQNIKQTKALLKAELENLKSPIQGLIKNYKNPFQRYTKKNINAHEALKSKDYIMRSFDSEGNLF
jgi:branched-chain amino acid transport system substrate-binding protein